MANGKIQPFTSLDQSKHHCYTLSTTCTLFKLVSEVSSNRPYQQTNEESKHVSAIEKQVDQVKLELSKSKEIILEMKYQYSKLESAQNRITI